MGKNPYEFDQDKSTDLDDDDTTTRVTSEPVSRFSEGERVRTPVGLVGHVTEIIRVGDLGNDYGQEIVYRVKMKNGSESNFPEPVLNNAPLPRLSLSDILELLDDAIRDHFTRVMSLDLSGRTVVEIVYSGSAGDNEFTRIVNASIAYETAASSYDMQSALDESINRAQFRVRNQTVYLSKYR